MESTQQRNLFCLTIVSLLFTSDSAPEGVWIRLSWSGSTWCSGRAEIYHNNTWGTVCDDSWDLNDTKLVCRQLDCGTALRANQSAHFGEGTEKIWLDNVTCLGNESSLTKCGHRGFGTHNCGHDEDAGVICSGRFPAPSISISPVGEVMRGHSVTITCSILNQLHDLLKGQFILTLSSSRENQTSDTNPAVFNILRVDLEKEGSYHCQYQTRNSDEVFSSPISDTVRLNVTEPLSLVVSLVAAGVLLKLLLLLLVVCLVRRRRRQVNQSGDPILTQVTIRNSYEDNDDDDDEDKRDYVNIEPFNAQRKQREEVGGTEEEDGDAHDYENMETEDNYVAVVDVFGTGQDNREEEDEEESSDDENDYVNAPKPLTHCSP